MQMGLAGLFERGRRRGEGARKRLADAYQALFAGRGGAEEAAIVLADLAGFTGFYGVAGPLVTAEQRAFADGKRAAYLRVLSQLRMSEEERRELEASARLEALADATEGEL